MVNSTSKATQTSGRYLVGAEAGEMEHYRALYLFSIPRRHVYIPSLGKGRSGF